MLWKALEDDTLIHRLMIELDSDWVEFTRFIESIHNKASK